MNPDTIYAGYDARRTYSLPKHDDSEWTLSARIVGGSEPVAIAAANATGSGTDWTLTVPATATAALASGTYTLQLIASDGTVTEIAGSETIRVVAASETDLRSSARKQLDAIEAVLEGKATKDETSISYNGRSISRMSWDEMLNARDRLARAVRAEERRAAGGKKIQSVNVRFVND